MPILYSSPRRFTITLDSADLHSKLIWRLSLRAACRAIVPEPHVKVIPISAAGGLPAANTRANKSPFPEFIKACRSWAFGVSAEAGDGALYAVAYCHAIRQLKYEEKNHPLAIEIAKCAANKLLNPP